MKKFKYFIGTFCLLFILFLTVSANAGLTVTNEETEIWGGHIVKFFDLTFDSSYAYDGEALTKASRGFSKLDKVIVFGKGNYQFEYDMTNEKVKVFGPAPPIVYEEQHSADLDGQFTLDYPAAFIVSVVRSGGTAYPVIYSGTTTLGTDTSCLPNGIDDGTRTGVSAYTPSTTYFVTYATQAWQDLYKLYVENELLTGAGVTRHTISGNTIFGLQSVKFGGAVSGCTPIDWADTAAAGEFGVDFGDYVAAGHSGATQAVCKIATGDEAVYMTYLKSPPVNSWLENHYIRDEDSTSGTSTVLLDRPLLLWLNSGYAVDNGNASLQIVLQDQPVFYKGDLLATGDNGVSGVSEIKPAWGFRGSAPDLTSLAQELTDEQVWQVHEGSVAIEHATYLFGHPWEIPNLVPLEIKNTTDLSGLNGVRVIMIGR